MNFVAGAHPVRSVSPVPVIISPRIPPPRVPIPWEAMGVVMPPEELHAHSAEMCDLVDKLGRCRVWHSSMVELTADGLQGFAAQ